MSSRGPLRYRLEAAEGFGSDVVFFPFWRFVGMRYMVLAKQEIRHSLLDATVPAFELGASGPTLGIAPQVHPLNVWTASLDAVEPQTSARKSIESVQKRADELLGMPFLFRRLIAETQCLIYAPFIIKEKSIVLATGRGIKRKVGEPELQRLERLAFNKFSNTYKVKFIPLMCPECASSLPPHPGALGLHCSNCAHLWFIEDGCGMVSRAYQVIATGREDVDSVFLPFWQLDISLSDIPIGSRAELLHLAAPYWSVPSEWKDEPVRLFIPAFKLNPRLYLNTAQRISLARAIPDEYRDRTPRDIAAEPVRVSLKEAAQAVKVVLARILLRNRKLYPLVAGSKVKIRSATLTYISYRFSGREYINQWTGTSIHHNALSLGRSLGAGIKTSPLTK
jgi:hypothetical protein